jgi:enoyl-CoA hydratase
LSTLSIERTGDVAIVRLQKGRGNAIDEPLVDDLHAACRDVVGDASVRGVLLASAHPRLFCPGLDLVALLDYDRASLQRFMLKFAAMMQALYALPKPLVAALSGHAVAGGCVLALTADYRILRRGGASIGLNEIRVGVPLPWSVVVLVRARVRPERITEVALLGRNFADEDALAAGLVNELGPRGGFEEACLARLAEFAEKDPVAYATTKKYLRADTLVEMQAKETDLVGEFLDSWFSDATRARIRETVASLGKPKD